jgi:nucleoside 2-deoxyribosyltransferase
MRVYLAGPITGLTHGEATNWRKNMAYFLTRMGHTAVSPMRGKDYLVNDGLPIESAYEAIPMSSAKGIYGRDSFDVAHCDILFVNLIGAKQVSIGTVMEIQMGRCLGKYVLVCM